MHGGKFKDFMFDGWLSGIKWTLHFFLCFRETNYQNSTKNKRSAFGDLSVKHNEKNITLKCFTQFFGNRPFITLAHICHH